MKSTSRADVGAWFAGRLPDEWFVGPPEVTADREEILVIDTLKDVDVGPDATDEERASARSGRINRFREETREQRIRIAREAEFRFRRKVAWGAECGEARELFTTLSVPMMTRLRMPERAVLDTLVDAGVARSRSHALAWCVRLVGDNEQEWIGDLRDALKSVERVRAEGPKSTEG
jgi:hypothetical protein